jgi:hypothetical protein
MADNYIYAFAGDPSALVLGDGDYKADSERPVGNQPGQARANFVNKALRQTSYMAALLAQFIVDNAEEDVRDSDTIEDGVTNLLLALNNSIGFVSGTKLTFFQAAAPLYWTKNVTYHDMALRVVNTSGGGIGGTHDLSAPPSINHDHTVAHTHSVPAPASHALTKAEIPTHIHSFDGSWTNVGVPEQSRGVLTSLGSVNTGNGAADGLAGAAHSHASGGDTGASSASKTGSATLTAFAPKYIDVILCTKD